MDERFGFRGECFYVLFSNLLHMDERFAHCQENIAKTYSKADIVFLKCKIHTHTHS